MRLRSLICTAIAFCAPATVLAADEGLLYKLESTVTFVVLTYKPI
jgi:hypothetical protein